MRDAVISLLTVATLPICLSLPDRATNVAPKLHGRFLVNCESYHHGVSRALPFQYHDVVSRFAASNKLYNSMSWKVACYRPRRAQARKASAEEGS